MRSKAIVKQEAKTGLQPQEENLEGGIAQLVPPTRLEAPRAMPETFRIVARRLQDPCARFLPYLVSVSSFLYGIYLRARHTLGAM